MKRILYQITGTALAVALLAGCTQMYFKKGTKSFDMLKYSTAIQSFEKVLEKKDVPAAKEGLANSYRLVNNTVKAEAKYADIVNQPDVDPINYFHYARMLMANGKYAEAKVWFAKYLSVKGDDKTAQILLASCDSTRLFFKDSARFKVKTVQLDGLENYYASALYKDGFIFSADRAEEDVDKVNPWTGNSYLDLYYTKQNKDETYEKPVLIDGSVNGPFHEAASIVTKDGNTMYFTRSNYTKNRLIKSKDNTNNLQLFTATLDGDKWKDLKPFQYNNKEYSTGHPAISPDGNTMYFVSDRPGTLGGTDLWMTKKSGDTWSEPVNMADLNTSLDEMFPFFCANDSTLYFSSEGHTNMGGLDVFYTKQIGDNKWSRPVNMGAPINTTSDDFAFTMKDDLINGYVSSTRTAGKDKIYSFVRAKKKALAFNLEGYVTDKKTGAAITNSKVEVIDMDTNTKLEFMTDDKGYYKTPLTENTSYMLVASKEQYSTATGDASTKDLTESETLRRDFVLDNFTPAVKKDFVLENVYYDLDKYNIRPDAAVELDKIVKLMNEYPSMVLELGSHTDSRASDQYNITLSENRAKSAVAYIVKRGISKDRMTWKGYGETQLVNGCKNDVQCTEDEHQRNRRTTFKVLSY